MEQAGKATRGAMGFRHTSALLLGSTAMALVATPAFAQVGGDAQDDTAIIVTGIRATIQDSIETKKDSVEVFDALSAEEIGDIPVPVRTASRGAQPRSLFAALAHFSVRP